MDENNSTLDELLGMDLDYALVGSFIAVLTQRLGEYEAGATENERLQVKEQIISDTKLFLAGLTRESKEEILKKGR